MFVHAFNEATVRSVVDELAEELAVSVVAVSFLPEYVYDDEAGRIAFLALCHGDSEYLIYSGWLDGQGDWLPVRWEAGERPEAKRGFMAEIGKRFQ